MEKLTVKLATLESFGPVGGGALVGEGEDGVAGGVGAGGDVDGIAGDGDVGVGGVAGGETRNGLYRGEGGDVQQWGDGQEGAGEYKTAHVHSLLSRGL